jgi:hypothetical protein
MMVAAKIEMVNLRIERVLLLASRRSDKPLARNGATVGETAAPNKRRQLRGRLGDGLLTAALFNSLIGPFPRGALTLRRRKELLCFPAASQELFLGSTQQLS